MGYKKKSAAWNKLIHSSEKRGQKSPKDIDVMVRKFLNVNNNFINRSIFHFHLHFD